MVVFFTTGAETFCEIRSSPAAGVGVGVTTDLIGSVLGVGVGVEIGTGTATAFASCVSFTFKVGDEKVKPAALRWSQPLCSFTTVVATLC